MNAEEVTETMARAPTLYDRDVGDREGCSSFREMALANRKDEPTAAGSHKGVSVADLGPATENQLVAEVLSRPPRLAVSIVGQQATTATGNWEPRARLGHTYGDRAAGMDATLATSLVRPQHEG